MSTVAGDNGILCRLCGKVVKFAKNLKRHFVDSHAVADVLYTCPSPSCGLRTSHRSKFYNHMLGHPEYRGMKLEEFASKIRA